MRLVKYFGPPGTGKTTRLLSHVSQLLEEGIPPDRIAFLAFTRKAAREARERAQKDLGLSSDDMPFWGTLHSVAARQLGIRGEDLITGEHWKILGNMLDMDFSELDDAGRPTQMKQDVGHRVQAAYSIRRARMLPIIPELLRQSMGGKDAARLDLFTRTLVSYKARRNLVDYADLLDEAPGALPVDAAFVDEAQDLTPAQWAYAKRAVALADTVYVAGDDDQAIYDWAGADVEQFLSLDGETIVLEDSHRVPLSVFPLAAGIAGRIKTRQPKMWNPNARQGAVHRVGSPDRVPVAESEGDWLLLARTRQMLSSWESVCRLAGVRYVRQGADSVRPDEAVAIRAWETVRRGGAVSDGDAAMALHTARIEAEPAFLHALPREAMAPWGEAMARIPPARRRYYEACLRRSPRALTDPAKINISTIHGAKGGEAQNVALLTDVTPRIAEGLRKNPDAEHRVWYVAATRAKEALWIVRPQSDQGYKI